MCPKSDHFFEGLKNKFVCSPWLCWFMINASLHIVWVVRVRLHAVVAHITQSGLFLAQMKQLLFDGMTTNEAINRCGNRHCFDPRT